MTDSDLKAAGWIVDVGEWSHPLMPGTQLQGMNIWAASDAETFARARISAALRPLVEAGKALYPKTHAADAALYAYDRDGRWGTFCSALADAERRLT